MLIDLDSVTVEYLVESGISGSIGMSAYRPGGELYTIKEARRWLVMNSLSLSVSDRGIGTGYGSVTIPVSDSIDAASLQTIVAAEIVFEGVTYAFDAMTAESETYEYYGNEQTDRWIELSFKAR